MQNIEFPQKVIEVVHDVTLRFKYDNGNNEVCVLQNPDEFLNENVPTHKPIVVILRDEVFYCGTLSGIEDEKGMLIVKIRSLICHSCVLSIPYEDILGWCLLPEKL